MVFLYGVLKYNNYNRHLWVCLGVLVVRDTEHGLEIEKVP